MLIIIKCHNIAKKIQCFFFFFLKENSVNFMAASMSFRSCDISCYQIINDFKYIKKISVSPCSVYVINFMHEPVNIRITTSFNQWNVAFRWNYKFINSVRILFNCRKRPMGHGSLQYHAFRNILHFLDSHMLSSIISLQVDSDEICLNHCSCKKINGKRTRIKSLRLEESKVTVKKNKTHKSFPKFPK